MVEDRIQELHRAWHEGRDAAAGSEVFELARQEWGPRIRKRLNRTPLARDYEDALHDLLADLLISRKGAPPRALAPDHVKPIAHRLLVLKRALADWVDKHGLRVDIVRAAQDGLTPKQMQAQRRARRKREHTPADASPPDLGPETRSAPTVPNDTQSDLIELRLQRRRVLTVLPQLAPKPRLMAALILGSNIEDWIDEASSALGVDSDELRQRMRSRDGTLAADIRVLHPHAAERTARDNWRKLHERTVAKLRELLASGGLSE